MISVDIEKEVNQENKVILNLNLRQVICVCTIVAFSIFFVVGLKMDIEVSMYPSFVVGGICLLFGWYKPNGIPFEKVLLKKIQNIIYRSNTRKYKTKNQYVVMMNDEYNRRRNMDLADKKIAKQVKREEKKAVKAHKKAMKKAVCKPVK